MANVAKNKIVAISIFHPIRVLSRMSSQILWKMNPIKRPITIDKMKQTNDKIKKLIILLPFPNGVYILKIPEYLLIVFFRFNLYARK